MNITIIGAGVMGSAFTRAWVTHKVIAPKNLTVCDPGTKKLVRLQRELGVRTSSDNISAVKGAGVVLLAVKPQQMLTMLADLKPAIDRHQLIISVAASISLRSIEKVLGTKPLIIRTMPNLPITIGEGITAWCANTHLTPTHKRALIRLLSAGAIPCEVRESQLNAITALSAVGQGILYAFMAALIEEIVKLRVPRPTADLLIRTTIAGAAKLLQQSSHTAQEMAAHVATKGGITEAALNAAHHDHLNRLVARAVRAAYRRARELSR